jgi:hypothetical protein
MKKNYFASWALVFYAAFSPAVLACQCLPGCCDISAQVGAGPAKKCHHEATDSGSKKNTGKSCCECCRIENAALPEKATGVESRDSSWPVLPGLGEGGYAGKQMIASRPGAVFYEAPFIDYRQKIFPATLSFRGPPSL